MTIAEHKLLDALRPGVRAYLSAGSAEPQALVPLLATDPSRAAGVNFIGSFVPGVNATDYAAIAPDARMTTLLLPAAARASFIAGKVDILPLSYAGFAAHLERLPPDIAIVHVTPPDAAGLCSLGPAADFAPIAWERAGVRIAFVNPSLPRPPGGWTLRHTDIDIAIDCDHAPLSLPPARPSAVSDAVAAHVAALIGDGATVQAGLGGAPAAAMAALTDRRGLVIHSGMISDEIIALAEAGALAPTGHRAGIAIGGAPLYNWLAGAGGVAFVPTPATHGALALAQTQRLTAINSALEVDLLGQANLEWRGGKLVSGIGGAPDFVAGARLSPGGQAVIALPATAKAKSRIVARIDAPSISIPRNVIDVVVTEHGAAHIRDLPLEARAQALIAIAAPEHRAALQAAWERLRNSLVVAVFPPSSDTMLV